MFQLQLFSKDFCKGVGVNGIYSINAPIRTFLLIKSSIFSVFIQYLKFVLVIVTEIPINIPILFNSLMVFIASLYTPSPRLASVIFFPPSMLTKTAIFLERFNFLKSSFFNVVPFVKIINNLSLNSSQSSINRENKKGSPPAITKPKTPNLLASLIIEYHCSQLSSLLKFFIDTKSSLKTVPFADA